MGEIGPAGARRGGGDFHGDATGALPFRERPVREHHPVPEDPEGERLAAAVGAAGCGDLLGVDQVLVNQEPEQVLGVADLVAGVHQADVALPRSRSGPRLLAAGRPQD